MVAGPFELSRRAVGVIEEKRDDSPRAAGAEPTYSNGTELVVGDTTITSRLVAQYQKDCSSDLKPAKVQESARGQTHASQRGENATHWQVVYWCRSSHSIGLAPDVADHFLFLWLHVPTKRREFISCRLRDRSDVNVPKLRTLFHRLSLRFLAITRLPLKFNALACVESPPCSRLRL